jgi:RNA polymerase sigma-70 factor (ECF subfamily)
MDAPDALVEDFTARRPRGFEAAYALWARELFGAAIHVVRDAAAAEDCVHDALVRVWRAPNTFSGGRQLLRAYLLMCVRNEALSTLRSQSRRSARELRAAQLDPRSPAAPPDADPVEAERVRAAIEGLPEEQRAALLGAFYENKTHLQIAAESGIPLGTIKSRIAMAMRKLRGALRPPEGARP